MSDKNPIAEIAQHIPDAPMPGLVGVGAIALQLAMQYADMSTVKDGVMYQQLRMDQKNIGIIGLADVFDYAKQIEKHLMETNERIIDMVSSTVVNALEDVLDGTVPTITSALQFCGQHEDEELRLVAFIVSTDNKFATVKFKDHDREFVIALAREDECASIPTGTGKLYTLSLVMSDGEYVIYDIEDYIEKVGGDTDLTQFADGQEITIVGTILVVNPLGFFTIELDDGSTSAVYCPTENMTTMEQYVSEKVTLNVKVCNNGERVELVSLDLYS